MRGFQVIAAILLVQASALPSHAADDVLGAIDQARKAYQAGDMAAAKQSLDLASQLIGQKDAESFAALLPAALAGWNAGKTETAAVGNVGFGASSASRVYTGPAGERVEVRITGDSAMIGPFAAILANPQLAAAMGKIIKLGKERGIQGKDGDINVVVASKYLIVVTGSAPPDAKTAYAQAIDVAKLSKM